MTDGQTENLVQSVFIPATFLTYLNVFCQRFFIF